MLKLKHMENLPKETVNVIKLLFITSGTDCLGSVTMKQYKRTRTLDNNQIERCGVLFSCLTTRVVNLELSIDMITDNLSTKTQQCIAWRGESDMTR